METSGQLHTPTTLPPGRGPNNNYVGDFVSPGDELEVLVTKNASYPCGRRTFLGLPARILIPAPLAWYL